MEEEDLMSVRVVTYNILDDGIGREAQIARVLATLSPDIVLLQEVAGERLARDLATQLSMAYYVAPGNSWRQVALLSRLPILAAQSHHPRPIHRAVLQASLGTLSGERLHILGVHLRAARLLPMETQRVRETQVIARILAQIQSEMVLVAGDFNACAPHDRVNVKDWTAWMRWSLFAQAGLIPRWALRSLLRNGLVDCFRRLHSEDDGFTLPASAPNMRLDYIFASLYLAERLRAYWVVEEPVEVLTASDHRPVVAEFEV
jgi:endonuclease/exonuclease/phosphatase family metal-dependent hydrolase